jgi:NAD(P)H-hydrate epimerase
LFCDFGAAPVTSEYLTNEPGLWAAQLPRLAADGHKYQRGHALILGGCPMTGAARLAAMAAARAGAGLTTIAVPEIAFSIYATALTSVMVYPLTDSDDLSSLLSQRQFSAMLIGPGAGVGAVTRANALAMLATGEPALLDADALTSFADNPVSLFAALGAHCALTPHEGEFARLFDFAGTRPERALQAARQSGAVMVLKGAKTVIASPDGRVIVNDNAPPTLATAGSGDVLGGIITGLLAQGTDSFAAAAAGVWIHGAAAAAFGSGLIADDLPGMIPGVLRDL